MSNRIEHTGNTPDTLQVTRSSKLVDNMRKHEHALLSSAVRADQIPDDKVPEGDIYDFAYRFEHAGHTFTALVCYGEEKSETQAAYSGIVHYTYWDKEEHTEKGGFIVTMGDDWDDFVYMLHEAIDMDYPDPNFVIRPPKDKDLD